MNRIELQERLSEFAEPSYHAFLEKLKVSDRKIYGVRSPKIDHLVKIINKEKSYSIFDELLEDNDLSYEEILILYKLFGIIPLSTEQRLLYLEKLLPYNHSWATNDTLASAMKWIEEDRRAYYPYFLSLLSFSQPYTKRLGIITLMLYYLEDTTFSEVLEKLSVVDSDHYYVMMALGWAYATAYCKHREATLPYFQYGVLSESVRKKAIQKCIESRLVSADDKAMLKILRQAPSEHS